LVHNFQYRSIELLSKKKYSEIKKYFKLFKIDNNYKYLGFTSANEANFALEKFRKWEEQCKKQMRIFTLNPSPPFDCLLNFKPKQSTHQNFSRNKFSQTINSGLSSRKFITCNYENNEILNFEQAGFIEAGEAGRFIFDRDDVGKLFHSNDFSYLRNFIINLDEAGCKSLENDSVKLVEVIDEFIEDCYSKLKYCKYQPRLFIYTTKPIYSTLPKPFQQKFKLITAPESNSEEAIIERVKSVVSEKYESRFGVVDWDEYWEKILVENGMEVHVSTEDKQVKNEDL